MKDTHKILISTLYFIAVLWFAASFAAVPQECVVYETVYLTPTPEVPPPCYARQYIVHCGGDVATKDVRIYGPDCWHGTATSQGNHGYYIESTTLNIQPWPFNPNL